MITTEITPRCPECGEKLEPWGNISHNEHRFGKTVEGKVRCSNSSCDFFGLLNLHVIPVEGSA